ncbi:mechanosensitive ion channel domain-containing protein [Arthrobacter sp. 35W]|uniref:mechanosensitive ion channel family protein n=1 Tax=Arthrobacter sp. 35W TaxID=1132441 RepID=UPI000414E4A0
MALQNTLLQLPLQTDLADAVPDALDGFWRHLLDAGIIMVIGFVIWLVLHQLIARVVKRAQNGTALSERRMFKWAHPVLRNLESERRIQRAETIGSLLNSVVSVGVVVVVGFYVLIAFEVNVAPLLTSIGILGIAIGFGCQQLIRDFLAGIFITIEDQYGIGDVIETSDVVGVVESVGLRITRVRAEDGAIWYLRNGEILRVGNRSQGNYVDPEAAGEPDASAGAEGERRPIQQEAGE